MEYVTDNTLTGKAPETKTKRRRVKYFIPVPTRSEHSPTKLIMIPHPPPPRDIFEEGVAGKLTGEKEPGFNNHTNDESLQVLGVAIDKQNVSERDHSNRRKVPTQGQIYPHPPAKQKNSVDGKMMDVLHKGRRVYFPYIKPEDRLPH